MDRFCDCMDYRLIDFVIVQTIRWMDCDCTDY